MTEHQYRPSAAVVLILSPDPLAAALLGAAVELSGCPIAFAASEESASQAFRRLRPACLVIDALDDEAFATEVLGPALMTGTRLVVFGTAASVAARAAIGREYHMDTLVMPKDVARLPQLIGGLARDRAPAR